MKILTFIMVLTMVFCAGAVFACDGPSGEDNDDQAFAINAQYLCGTCGCTKKKAESKPEKDADSDDEEEAEDKEEADDQCGGDKGDEPAPEPEAMCGGSGCGKDKDETEA